MNYKLAVILFAFCMVFIGREVYASSCYKSHEAEAEQGIRIHSELMVIGLNCQHMATANGKNLYAAYREFTAQYGSLFGGYEDTMMAYYSKNGVRNPESSINTMRTQFANKISKDVADMRPDIFCNRYAPRIKQAVAMSRDQLKAWASTIYPSHPVSKPLCSGG